METNNGAMLLGAVALDVCLGIFLGDKRKIGIFWSIFFCAFFSPVFGIAFILTSPKKTAKEIRFSKTYYNINFISAAISFIFGIFLVYGVYAIDNGTNGTNIVMLSLGIGFIGWGIYLFQRTMNNLSELKKLSNEDDSGETEQQQTSDTNTTETQAEVETLPTENSTLQTAFEEPPQKEIEKPSDENAEQKQQDDRLEKWDNFEEVCKIAREKWGRELTQSEIEKIRELTDKIAKAKQESETADKKLIAALDEEYSTEENKGNVENKTIELVL